MAQRDGEGHLGFHRDPVSGDIKFDLNPPSALPLFSEISREATRLTDLLGWDPLPSEQNAALRHESAVYSQALKAVLARLVEAEHQRDDARTKLEALWREFENSEKQRDAARKELVALKAQLEVPCDHCQTMHEPPACPPGGKAAPESCPVPERDCGHPCHQCAGLDACRETVRDAASV